jgi:site-specific recombinase XerD
VQLRRIEGRGDALTYHAFRKQFQRYVMRTGLDDYDVTIRSARAAVASKLLDDGVDPWSVAKILGHQTLSMVMHYDKRKTNILKSPIRKLSYE